MYVHKLILCYHTYINLTSKIMNESQRAWITHKQLDKILSIAVWAEEFSKLQDSSIAYQSTEEIKDLIDHILTQNHLVRVEK